MPINEQFRVVIRQLEPHSLSSQHKLTIATAAQFFESAVRSDYFRQRVENFGGGRRGFMRVFGETNAQVYDALIRARERVGNVDTLTADLYLQVVQGNGSEREIGYVNPNSKWIYTYERYLTAFNIGRIAAHFAHEWTHVLGYTHPEYSEENLDEINRTVPYAIQHIVMDYAEHRLRDFILNHV